MTRQSVEILDERYIPKNVKPQTDDLPHVYLALSITNPTEVDQQWLRGTGCRYRCVNFAYVVPEAFSYAERARAAYINSIKNKIHLMVDSSAFSFHNFAMKQTAKIRASASVGSMSRGKTIEELREEVISQYIKFCKSDSRYWDFAVTFDFVKECSKIYAMTKRLERAGLKVSPVYHGDSPLSWLKRYLDEGYKHIGIGTLPWRKSDWKAEKAYYESIFELTSKYSGVKLHAFAMTSISISMSYPWHSVDSSSWSRSSGYGCICLPDLERCRMTTVQVSTAAGHRNNPQNMFDSLAPSVQKEIKRKVEERGFDFGMLQTSPHYRFIFNGQVFSRLNDFKPYVQQKHKQWGRLF